MVGFNLEVDLAKILVFDPRSRMLYDSRELMFSMNGDNLQITLPSSSAVPVIAQQEPTPKKTRKRSKYNRTLSKNLEMLKKKHPRTKQSALMKKAHAETRKALGMPAKRRRK